MWLPLTCPPLGTWPTTQACAMIGNRTSNPLVRSPRSVHWATPARALMLFFLNNSLKRPKFLWASPQVCPWQPDTKFNSRRGWTGTSSGSRHMDAAEKPSRLALPHLWAYRVLCSLTSPAIYYISQVHIFSNFSNLLYLLSVSRCFCLWAPGVRARSWHVHSLVPASVPVPHSFLSVTT